MPSASFHISYLAKCNILEHFSEWLQKSVWPFLLEGLVVDIYCELEPNLRITKRFSPTNHQIRNTPNNVKT